MRNARFTTWENVGTSILNTSNVEEALHKANLDYTVEKVPVYLENGLQIPKTFCTKREGSDTIYGVVGDQFEIVQNVEGFEFINSLVPEGLKFLKAGENSKFIYIIAELPSINVLGDTVTPHVIFQNSHCGSTTLKATIAPLRIVCQNQFNLTFRKATNKISLRHTKSIKGRLHTAQEVLSQNTIYLDEFQKEALRLSKKKICKARVDEFVDELFIVKSDASSSQITRAEEKRERFLTAYNAEDNQNFKGTAWGLINAYTDFVTHKPLQKDTPQALENHFIKTTLKRDINDFYEMVNRI